MKRLILPILFVLGLFGPHLAEAKVHFVNKGVKYHIGDNRFALSEDSTFVGAHDTVGQEWIQGFTVSEADQVKVHIDKIWGVDDCPYCKVIISIDDKDMLRLFQSNNNKPVETLAPLAQTLQPGVTHYLKIASYGSTQVDDFMIQDVWVETQVADVVEVGPVRIADPEPEPTPFVPRTQCETAVPNAGWLPGEAEGKTQYEMLSKDRNGLNSGVLGKLAPGEAIDFYLQVDTFTEKPGIVDHAMEFTLQGDEKRSQEKEGWVVSFRDAQGSQLHGNMIRGGIYRPEAFVAGGYQANAWNRVRLQSCGDGQIRLLLNNKAASLSVPSGLKTFSFSIRALGLRALIAKSPQNAAPPAGDLPAFSPGGL